MVSLKDGMFNNANVLFKTKFVDGVSTVTRYTQVQPKGAVSHSQREKPQKKATKRPRRADDDYIEAN